MTKTKIELNKIEKLYGVTDAEKFYDIKNEIKTNGFINIQNIVVLENDFGYFAVTGSHRYAAYVSLGIEEIEVDLYQENEIPHILDRSDVDDQGKKLLSGEDYGNPTNSDWLF